MKIKKRLRNRQGRGRGPCLELLHSLGLLASLVAVRGTVWHILCARHGMAQM